MRQRATIINGAQSTGAIGAVESLKEDFLVPIRFIVCSDPKIIEEIHALKNFIFL